MSEEEIRIIYVHASEAAKKLESALNKIEEEEDENFTFAISDAKNVMNVLSTRAGWKLGISG